MQEDGDPRQLAGTLRAEVVVNLREFAGNTEEYCAHLQCCEELRVDEGWFDEGVAECCQDKGEEDEAGVLATVGEDEEGYDDVLDVDECHW